MSKTTNPNDQIKSEHEQNLITRAHKVEDDALQKAVWDEAVRRMQAFSDGVNAYHHHLRSPRPFEPPCLAQVGAARLLDYGALGNKSDGPPVLIIPSLINRSYVLDLSEHRSLVRYMAQQGLRPLLVDWGTPGETEATFDLTAYVTGPLQDFLDISTKIDGRPATVVGYCMGGLLALALAERSPTQTKALALLATPWDFHAVNHSGLVHLQALKPGIALMLDEIGHLPVDLLQVMFASLQPSLTNEKFRSFAHLQKNSAQAQAFVALEDWLNDGVPLVAPVARECLFDWYLENAPVEGKWLVDGQVVSPQKLTCPTLTVIPQRDTIVPPQSALALAKVLPNNETWPIKTGHIGMVAGSHAKSSLYEPLVEWIRSINE